MFEHLRTRDAELFQKLGLVCQYLARSTRLLEQMLAGRSGDEGHFAHAIHESDREAHDVAREVDVRAFKTFVMSVDRMDLHALITALDATVDTVDKAALHAATLHAAGAPESLRALAALLTRAAEELEAAVSHVWDAPQEVERHTSAVRHVVDSGQAAFDAGLAALFSGAPDAIDVLRWKDLYEKLRHALGRCAEAADLIHQITNQATS